MSLRKLRIIALRLAFAPVVFVAVFVRPSWGLESDIAFWVELVGYLFLLAGLSVRIWCILYIGGRKSHELVTDGPYSLCRNPLYMGTFLLVVGAGLCFENVPMLILMAAVIVPAHVVVAKLEARHLAELFPTEYPAYAERVPMFWPRFSGYHSPSMIAVSAKSIRRIAVDTAAVILIPEIEDLLELLHEHHVMPVLWHWP